MDCVRYFGIGVMGDAEMRVTIIRAMRLKILFHDSSEPLSHLKYIRNILTPNEIVRGSLVFFKLNMGELCHEGGT